MTMLAQNPVTDADADCIFSDHDQLDCCCAAVCRDWLVMLATPSAFVSSRWRAGHAVHCHTVRAQTLRCMIEGAAPGIAPAVLGPSQPYLRFIHNDSITMIQSQ